ncbi:MAG: hypothetical protein WCO00_06390 [Rhodospirillaceae bacterium]
MAITATSSVSPLPQLTALQAKQVSDYTPPATTAKSVSLPTYASPIYKFDPLAKLSIEVIRDTSTGSVISQIPPEQVVQRYRLGQITAATNGISAQTSALTAANAAAAGGAAGAGTGANGTSGAGGKTGSSVSITV